MKITIPDKEKELIQKLLDSGYEAYVVGGYIRDTLIGLKPKDVDIFTNANGSQILEVFKNHNTKILGGEERQEKILTVLVDNVEISQYRSNGERTETGSSLEEHLKTCDFTVNSLACDINGNIIDINNGLEDLKFRDIDFVGDAQQRINEDPLRILRGVRQSLTLNLKLSLEAESYIEGNIHLLKNLPQERVRDEFNKMLGSKRLISTLDWLEFLELYLPFINEQRKLPSGKYHGEKDTYDHTTFVYQNACALTDNPLLLLAALLHDCGKSDSKSFDDDGEVHFYEHHKIGADIAREWMTNMKYSKSEIDYVSCLIYNHMHGYDSKEPSKKSYLKLFKELEDNNVPIEDFVTLRYCDNQGNLFRPRVSFNSFLRTTNYINRYYRYKYETCF